MKNRIKFWVVLSTCMCIAVTGGVVRLSTYADNYTITDGLPSFNAQRDIAKPDRDVVRSLDFEVIKDRPLNSNSNQSSSSNSGSSLTNDINQQTNTARIKEQNSDPFKKAINNAELHPHFRFPLYNIKNVPSRKMYNNAGVQRGIPMRYKSSYEQPITMDDIEIIDKFASEHFTDDMTNYDKIEYTWLWLHENLYYATGSDYATLIAPYTNVYAAFVNKAGQCLQCNGALCAVMSYMGYDVYMMEMFTSGQHFRMEIDIDGEVWGVEVGNLNNTGADWKWLGNKSKANIPDHSLLPDNLYDWRNFSENKYKSVADNDDRPARV